MSKLSLTALLKKAEALNKNPLEALEYSFGRLSPETVGTSPLSTLLDLHKNSGTADEIMTSEMELFGWLFGPRKRSEGVFHPSEISNEDDWCKRKFYYDVAKAPKDEDYKHASQTDNQLLRLFDLGTMVHMYIQWGLYQKGLLKAREVHVTSDEFLIDGHTDGLVEMNGKKYTLEIKTMNTFQFGKLEAPVEKQVRQASIYADLSGTDGILMLYYDKNNSAIKYFEAEIDQDFVDRFKELAKEIKDSYYLNLRKTRSKDVEQHETPKRKCRNNLSERAINCPYRTLCFKGD